MVVTSSDGEQALSRLYSTLRLSGMSLATRAPARLLATVAAVVLLVVASAASAGPARAGSPPNRLDDNTGNLLARAAVNTLVTLPPFTPFFLPVPPLLPPPIGPLSGRVLDHPSIFNVFWDDNWDDHHSGAFSTGSIDNMTRSLVGSRYFDFASQYGVGSASFDGSNTSGGFFNPCPDTPGSTTNFISILAFIECEASLLPTGVPSPGGNSLYVVYLPLGTTIDNFGINKSCDSFGAYHFMGTAITLLGGREFPFAVIPLDCAHGTADGLSELVSHEVIEASTDPNVVMGWIDNSKFSLTNIQPLFTEGEAADICEQGVGDAATPPVRLDNGLLVATYWSNRDNACVPITHTFHLDETGLPATVPHQAVFDGSTVSLPFDTIVDDGTTHSYSFPTPVNDPSPGTRYVTSEPPASFAVTANFSKTAVYTTQHFLTVQAQPPAAAALDATLTPSAWENAGSTVPITTDALIVAGIGNCFRFDHWSGDASGTSTSTTVLMNGPKTAIANYITGCPTTTTVTSSPNPSLFGQPVNFTATVTAPPGAGTPTGSVTFFDGANELGTATLTAGGTATLTIAALQGGSHTITADYAGDGGFLPSSGTLTHVVTFTSCVTTLRVGPLTIGSGEAVCITGMVVGPVTVNPGGALSVSGGNITGPLTSTGATAISICASTGTGPISISGTSGLLLIGDGGDDGTPACTANTVNGGVTLTGNLGGLELGGNTIHGPVTLSNNTGTGQILEHGTLPPPEVEGNQMVGPLRCDGNTPAPIDDGLPNSVIGPKLGQCGAPGF
jgi:hypothetical protein